MSDAHVEGEVESVGDTTVRRPRVPVRREAASVVIAAEPEADGTGDTIVVPRGVRRRPVAETSDGGIEPRGESGGAALSAYGSRAASPVRGSRRASAGDEADAGAAAAAFFVPDAEAIARASRARARRRLLAVVLAIVTLVVALVAILALLLFAVGV